MHRGRVGDKEKNLEVARSIQVGVDGLDVTVAGLLPYIANTLTAGDRG
jgi:hypothetical protein